MNAGNHLRESIDNDAIGSSESLADKLHHALLLQLAQLLLVVASTLVIRVEISPAERGTHEQQQSLSQLRTYPEYTQSQHLQNEEDPPNQRAHDLAEPEEGVIDWVHHSALTGVFEPPLLLPVLIDLTPPTQSHQQPARDIFDHPEVQRTQDDHDDEGGDVGDETTYQQVEEDACSLETKSGDAGDRMTSAFKVEPITVGCARFIADFGGSLHRPWRRNVGDIALHADSEVEVIGQIGHLSDFLNISRTPQIQGQARPLAIIVVQMSKCLKWLCCCCQFTEQNPELPRRQNLQKKKPKPSPVVQSRLTTKYAKQEFARVEDQQRNAGKVKAYCCPICFLYYRRILACSQCCNFTCLACFEMYDRKNKSAKQEMKCPFCASTISKFVDYELEPHSYFDASRQGFITKEERSRIDNQALQGEGTSQEIGLGIPAEMAISLPELSHSPEA